MFLTASTETGLHMSVFGGTQTSMQSVSHMYNTQTASATYTGIPISGTSDLGQADVPAGQPVSAAVSASASASDASQPATAVHAVTDTGMDAKPRRDSSSASGRSDTLEQLLTHLQLADNSPELVCKSASKSASSCASIEEDVVIPHGVSAHMSHTPTPRPATGQVTYNQEASMDLRNAAMRNDIRAMETALASGANINYSHMPLSGPAKSSMNTPLDCAVYNNHADSVQWLLSKGANPQMPTVVPPLHVAVTFGYIRVAELLLQNGADANIRNTAGQTALHLMKESRCDVTMIRMLLQHGADPNAEDKEGGWTPLHIASQFGHVDAIQTLLQRGADVEKKTRVGATPYQIAKTRNQRAAMLALQAHLNAIFDQKYAEHWPNQVATAANNRNGASANNGGVTARFGIRQSQEGNGRKRQGGASGVVAHLPEEECCIM
eukprot:GDKI01044123.1.p1 GENE.GDKI01044123.1~~GDKI01044123.1.p1  ORF type:complete len:513 (-),score=90.40 GDKI01044123.1:175-1485(-)